MASLMLRMHITSEQIFSYGMQNELKMDQTIINKVFPSLEELVKIAVQFNDSLQAKQRTGHPVETIGDVLVNQVWFNLNPLGNFTKNLLNPSKSYTVQYPNGTFLVL